MIVYINGIKKTDFLTQEVNLNYDSICDTFSFSMPFLGESIFAPLNYYSVDIFDDSGKRKLLTGVILNSHFKSNSNANEITISGYSKTGILGDCPNIPDGVKTGEQNSETQNNDPLNVESNGASSNFGNISLLELTKTLIKPFGISVSVDDIVKDKVNEAYESTTTTLDESVSAYLSKLATLKNVVLRGNAYGEIVFTQIDDSANPVVKFQSGVDPLIEMSLEVNGQQMFNQIHISGRANLDADVDKDSVMSGEGELIINPLVKLATRQTLKVQGTEITLIKDVAKAALADELKNITVSIEIVGQKLQKEEDDNGNIILTELVPGDLVDIYAPDIFIKKSTKFMIRSIVFKENAKERTQSIKCVLPQTMTGNNPSLIFG